jgi:hypothetical protein
MNNQNNAPSTSDLLAIIADLKAKLDAKPAGRKVSMKVSEKGCVSVFGGNIRKFGATFYAAEWQSILDHADDLRQFIKANDKLIRDAGGMR